MEYPDPEMKNLPTNLLVLDRFLLTDVREVDEKISLTQSQTLRLRQMLVGG